MASARDFTRHRLFTEISREYFDARPSITAMNRLLRRAFYWNYIETIDVHRSFKTKSVYITGRHLNGPEQTFRISDHFQIGLYRDTIQIVKMRNRQRWSGYQGFTKFVFERIASTGTNAEVVNNSPIRGSQRSTHENQS